MAVEPCGHLAPPGGYSGKSTRCLPIDLWRQEIDGAAREPRHGIAVNLIILPVAAYGAGLYAIPVSHSLRRARHAGRADAEAHPRLGRFHHVVDVLDHLIDVLASPVALTHRSAVGPIGIIQIGIERERRIVLIVEIIVKHQSINVILDQNVLAHVNDTLPHLGDAGIEHRLVAGSQQPFRMGIDVVPLALAPQVVAMPITIGIDPGIDLDTALVSLTDEILKRVERRRHTAGARDVARPGLVGRIVHRVTHRPDVVIDYVDVVDAQRVEHLAAGILHSGRVALGDGAAGPVAQVSRHPHAALFAFGRHIGSNGKTGDKCHQQCYYDDFTFHRFGFCRDAKTCIPSGDARFCVSTFLGL